MIRKITYTTVIAQLLVLGAFAQLNWENFYNYSENHSTSPWEIAKNGDMLFVPVTVKHQDDVSNKIPYHPSINLSEIQVMTVEEDGDVDRFIAIQNNQSVPGTYTSLGSTYFNGTTVIKPFIIPGHKTEPNVIHNGDRVAYVRYDMASGEYDYYVDQQNLVYSVITEGETTDGLYYSITVKSGQYGILQLLNKSLDVVEYHKIDQDIKYAGYDAENDVFYVIAKDEEDVMTLNSLTAEGTITSVATIQFDLYKLGATKLFVHNNTFVTKNSIESFYGITKFDMDGEEIATKYSEWIKDIVVTEDGGLIFTEYDQTLENRYYKYYQLDGSFNTVYSYTSEENIHPTGLVYDSKDQTSYVLGFSTNNNITETYLASYDYYEEPDENSGSESNSNSIDVFPNPYNGAELNIKSDGINFRKSGNLSVEVLDSFGNSHTVQDVEVQNRRSISMSNLELPPGTYNLIIRSEGKVIGQAKFVINRE